MVVDAQLTCDVHEGGKLIVRPGNIARGSSWHLTVVTGSAARVQWQLFLYNPPAVSHSACHACVQG